MRGKERAIEGEREREGGGEQAHVSINMVFHYFNISFSVQPPNSSPPVFLPPLFTLYPSAVSPSLPPSLPLSLSYSISLKARYEVLLRMAARYCSIVAGWRTLSALVISSHEGSLITAAQRASLHPHRPFSYPRCRPQHPGFKDSHFPNSIRVCERSICQNCLQCNWAAYLCPWDSADASPHARPACRSASARSPAPPVLPPRTDWCLWTLSAGQEQTRGRGSDERLEMKHHIQGLYSF